MVPEPFRPARLAASRRETELLRTLVLDAPADVRESYAVPGQYLKLRLPGFPGEGSFAIASAPGEPAIELLVKRSEGLADKLSDLPDGSAVEITPARGNGFPLGDARGRDVLLFATGSGIAPIRAVLRHMLKTRETYGTLHLFFGVRTGVDFPYREELETYERSGIRVHRVMSKSDGGGYVQERFRRELPEVRSAVAFLCGVKGMLAGTTEALVEAGLPAERIHTNA